MAAQVRKLLVVAAADGLVVQSRAPASNHAIVLAYGDGRISARRDEARQEGSKHDVLEVHGLIGILTVASTTCLLAISRRDLVATISGKPVYCITEVALLPLSSQVDAEKAILRARDSQLRHASTAEESLTDVSDEEEAISLAEEYWADDPDPEPAQIVQGTAKPLPVSQQPATRSVLFGRFAERWMSIRGAAPRLGATPGKDQTGNLPPEAPATQPADEPQIADDRALTGDQVFADVSAVDVPIADAADLDNSKPVPTPISQPEMVPLALIPKLLRTARFLFGSKNFFFAYDHDLSRRASYGGSQHDSALYESFDHAYFWNQHLTRPFVNAGFGYFIVPLIQGFVGQRTFTADVTPRDQESSHDSSEATTQDLKPEPPSATFQLTLISRRSVNRAGVRYLRRGVDNDGCVANGVETEQILCTASPESNIERVYSYVQYRGSMPLFFSQSPYGLKPTPVFRGSFDQNLAAFKLHFSQLFETYGTVQAVSLVEKKGTEGKVGELYEKLVDHAKSVDPSIQGDGSTDIDGRFKEKLAFEWFDFHAICKGFHFENVSLLFSNIGEKLDSFGWTEVVDSHRTKEQSGVLRTNCMDCLDRTNVVQSACGGLVLEKQLGAQDVQIDLQKDIGTAWFNTLWADNGDAISRQYAGTAALKGDFTRTRRRNISGALADFGLSLGRYYNNIVNDYFAQAVIDFLLGRADESILIEFEADMKSRDYAVDLRTVRDNAIKTCTTLCIEGPGEPVVGSWVLACPRTPGTLKATPFEECVLLLTDAALYFCRMLWTVEKVSAFEKINLDSITELSRGTYITSTFAMRDTDERHNVGFVVKYSPGQNDLVRVNTRSLSVAQDGENDQAQLQPSKEIEKLLAFKALPPKSSYETDTGLPTEADLVKMICEKIVEQANKSNVAENSPTAVSVKEVDIISLQEARKSTGYLETIGHSLKKLVWS